MRILHTADIHLRSVGDCRWQALETILGIANSEDVDLLVISGDLFDSGTDAETLRPKIRAIFSDSRFDILILPGNHDMDSYREGLYFGNNATVLSSDEPVEKYDKVRIIGLPYKKIGSVELLGWIRSFKEICDKKRRNILLYHGELLDAFFSREDFGDEGKERYMPLKLSYLEQINVDYILAGHFHTNFLVRRLNNGGYFVYPGSPVSITKRELGIRKVDLFDLGDTPEEYELDTEHYKKVDISLDPTEDIHPIESIKSSLKDIHPLSMVILEISGAINGAKFNLTEDAFQKLIKDATAGLNIVEERFICRDVRHIVEDDLYKVFAERVLLYPEERRKELRDIAIRAMLKE